MANQDIPSLPAAVLPLDGTEQVHLVQGGNSRRAEVQAFDISSGSQGNAIGLAQFSRPPAIGWVAQDETTLTGTSVNGVDTGNTPRIFHSSLQGLSTLTRLTEAGAGNDFDIVLRTQLRVTGDTDVIAGATIRNTATDAFILLGFDASSDQVFVKRYTAMNVFDSEIAVAAFNLNRIVDLYWRVERVGVDLNFYVSVNGLFFELLHTETVASFIGDVDAVGIALDSVNATARTTVRLVGLDEDGIQPEITTAPISENNLLTAAFTPPSPTGWTAINSSVAPLEQGYDATTQRLRMRSDAGGGVHWLVRSVPGGGDFDYVFLISPHVPLTFPIGAGVTVRNSANGNSINFNIFNDAGFYRTYYTGTSFTSEADIDGDRWALSYRNTPMWVRLRRQSDVLTVELSQDGIEFQPLAYSENVVSGHLSGDIDEIGIYMQKSSQTNLTSIALVGLDLTGPREPQAIGAAGAKVVTQIPTSLIEDANLNRNAPGSDFAGNVVVEMNNAAPNTVTIISGIGAQEPCTYVQKGAGQTSFVAGAGVTILSALGALNLTSQYSAATLIPLGSDTYYLVGDIVI